MATQAPDHVTGPQQIPARLAQREPSSIFAPWPDRLRSSALILLVAGLVLAALAIFGELQAARAVAAFVCIACAALVDQPLLPVSIDAVKATGTAGAAEPYPIQFTCSLADNKAEFTDGLLYHRGTELIVVPVLEKLSGGLLVRNRDSTVVLTVPGGTLKPGKYTVTLIGARTSRRWTVQVH